MHYQWIGKVGLLLIVYSTTGTTMHELSPFLPLPTCRSIIDFHNMSKKSLSACLNGLLAIARPNHTSHHHFLPAIKRSYPFPNPQARKQTQNNKPQIENPKIYIKKKKKNDSSSLLPHSTQMISDASGRRILTFPAVRPSPTISTPTLVNSLLSFITKITNHKPKTFIPATIHTNSRSLIRLIEVLQFLLEELRDGNQQSELLDTSIIFPLSELHLVFQKFNFLFEDCTRPDARLWILVRSTTVSSHFHSFLAELATVLDVLLLSLDAVVDFVSEESKWYVRFVLCQIRKMRSDLGLDDHWASKLVIATFSRFQNNVIPDPSDLKRVLEYLRVRKWSDCDRQIRFLEQEIRLQASLPTSDDVGDGGPISLLHNLVGFMTYCRCVMFDAVDTEIAGKCSNTDTMSVINFLNPEDFRCPISLEIMFDPVTISTGHTYDRGSILEWFRAGNPTCPNTGERVRSLELVPNLALQKIIKQYCTVNRIQFPKLKARDRAADERCVSAGAVLPAEGAMRMAADFLTIKLVTGNVREKSKSAYEIRLLSKKSAFSRACFVESGATPYLLNRLLLKDSAAQENAIAALMNLSKNSLGKTAIIDNGGLRLVLRVLKHGLKMESRQHSAAVIFYLSSVEECRVLMGNSSSEVIPALVELIRVGSDRAKRNALVAIFALLLHPANHRRVLCGTKLVSMLANQLRTSDQGREPDDEDVTIDSLAVLSSLSEKPDGATAILRDGALDTVVKILCSPVASRFGKEHCVSMLLALCINGGREVVEVLGNDPSLMGSLYSLLTNGTSRASKKARSLINILHEFSEKSSSSHSLPHGLPPREHFIHVW